ncbi:hypothetical protein HALA3H3_30151 [Halomonas sp. A3H3]|nr:hypothetical protein HALA3H3_30151 [Halomonas sp. A3H3]VXC19071.1 conserved hypothetical protein [Halomonas titanicae]
MLSLILDEANTATIDLFGLLRGVVKPNKIARSKQNENDQTRYSRYTHGSGLYVCRWQCKC